MRTLASRMRRRRDDEGATAVLVVLLAIVLFAAAALAVDYSSLTMERQRLHDHVDASAHAGAYELPTNGAGAVEVARDMASSQDPAMTPDIDLWCVVKSSGGAPAAGQIPATCNPGPPPYTSASYPGTRCNARICAIPCFAAQGDECNAVRVSDEKTVPFGFGRVIGVNQGDTGAVTTLACKGSCGEESPNPLDVVVMADRTPSMLHPDREQMIDGIRAMLTTMDPALHYVAFGVLHKSRAHNGCATANTPAAPSSLNTMSNRDNSKWASYAQYGTWVPVPFSNNYLNASKTAVNGTSALGRALTCVYDQADDGGKFGTQLAASMKGAARYLLGLEGNNLSSLPARTGEAKKVLIFETDGSPDETWKGGSTSLTSATDVASGWQRATSDYHGSDANGVAGCNTMIDVADAAKARGVTVITIGYGQAATNGCARRDSGPQVAPFTRDALAKAASPAPDGSASTASTCANAGQRAAENTDGDYYFCAASGSELADIFKTAISQVTTSIKYLKMPD